MSKFKQYYTEFAPVLAGMAGRAVTGYIARKVAGKVTNAVASRVVGAAANGVLSTGIKGITGIFASQSLRKLGLDNTSLNILSNGKYFSWTPAQKLDFEKDYTRFLNLNRNLRNASQEERLHAALAYFRKSGRMAVVNGNPYADPKLDLATFSQKIKMSVRGVSNVVNNFATRHGSTTMTILKSMK